jgi:hypothetical protein
LVVQELGRQLEFKDSLAPALVAWWDGSGLVPVREPKGVLERMLLLGVAEYLTRVFLGGYVKELEVGAYFGGISVMLVYKLLKNFILHGVLGFVFNANILISIHSCFSSVFISLISSLLLVLSEQAIGHFVSNAAILTSLITETECDECLLKLLSLLCMGLTT